MSTDARALWLGLTLLGLGLGAPSSIAPAFAQEQVGAETCGSCHEAQLKKWRSSGHALALARLSKTQRRDRVCRSCHTMAPDQEDPRLQGVQCESCHGAGGHYSPSWVMRDPVLAKLYGLEAVTEETCKPCHTTEGPSLQPFVYADKVALVCHVDQPRSAPGPAEEAQP